VAGEISGMRFARESFISVLSFGKLLSPMCFQGTCNTELFNIWLKQMLIPKLKPGQVLILDNASFHRSEESKKLVEAAGCKLLFLPPYSPDLNPIEKLWLVMKAEWFTDYIAKSPPSFGDPYIAIRIKPEATVSLDDKRALHSKIVLDYLGNVKKRGE